MNSTEYLIKYHETKKDVVYYDTEKVKTCGIGHALHLGSKVPEAAIQAFFEQDMKDAINLYDQLGLDLDYVRRAAIIDMCFNLGAQLKKWKLINRLREKDWEGSGRELVDSKWWDQVGRRSRNIKHMILTGEWPKLK